MSRARRRVGVAAAPLLLLIASRIAFATAPADTTAVVTAPADTVAGMPADRVTAGGPSPSVAIKDADEAAIDSLNAYWRALDTRWYEPLTPELLRTGFDDAALDSLTQVGDRELDVLGAGRRWRLTVRPLARVGFNRCEGARPGGALRLRRLRPRGAQAELGAGYGIARERFILDGRVTLPLATGGTGRGGRAGRDADDGGRPRFTRPWTAFALDVEGLSRPIPFGGRGDVSWGVWALLTGDDPIMYYDQRGGRAELAWRPRRWLEGRVGGLYEEHRPLPVVTTWSLLGDAADVSENWVVSPLTTRAVTASVAATGRGGRYQASAGAQWHRLRGEALGDGRPGPANLLRLAGAVRGAWLDRRGDELELRAAWWGADRAAPLEWKSYLGGPGSLRGYPVRELAGDRAALASLDLRAGFDLLRALRIPLLGRLGLQPLVFADWGWTETAGGPPPPEGIAAWRADAGVGLGRLLGAAGIGGNLRLYLGKPILNGQGDRGWTVLMDFEP